MQYGLGLFEIFVQLIYLDDDETTLILVLEYILNLLGNEGPEDFQIIRKEVINRLSRVEEFEQLKKLQQNIPHIPHIYIYDISNKAKEIIGFISAFDLRMENE